MKINYELPDGQVIQLNNSRFMGPEVFFFPNEIYTPNERTGLHSIVNTSINECDIYLRRELYGNMILSGGNTCFSGLPNRLAKELDAITPKPGMVNIIASPDRKNSTWTGGMILASLNSLAD